MLNSRRSGTAGGARRPVVMAWLIAALTFVSLLLPATAASAVTGSTLAGGQRLAPGDSLVSPSGAYRATFQTDGNFVVYGRGSALWYTGTQGSAAASLVLQGDGNLVIYNASGAPLWTTATNGTSATSLVMQDDGNLVLYTPANRVVWATNTQVSATPQQPQPSSTGDRLTPGQKLTTMSFLTSPSGKYTLKLATNGQLVLTGPPGALWATPTQGTAVSTALLQTDGNFVLYNSSGAQWSTGTAGKQVSFLVLQDDGNLVMYGPAGALWTTGTSSLNSPAAGSDRLLNGQVMRRTAALKSANGAYTFVMQTDGNLVLYGPQGATWASNTSGWSMDTAILQSDGNFVLYSSGGVPLYSTGTTTGSALVMQNDGNLVLYAGNGAPVWSSFYSPPPPQVFPPVTAPPPTAISHYFRNLYGNANDVTFTWNAGCNDARANPSGSRYIVFLAYGAQASNVNGSWGVQLSATTLRITNAAVVASANGYIDGYTACMAPNSWVTVSVGTNNDGEQAGLGSTGGTIWGQDVINPIAAHAAGRQVTVAGANDMEPGFNGTPAQAQAWMGAYLAATSAPFVWTGSADGCPQTTTASNAACNYGWTPRVLYDLIYGAMPNRALPLPQIYYTSQAKQWVNISLVGLAQVGAPAQYAGPLTEVTACAQANSCYSMSPVDAWNTFWNLLAADPGTRQDNMPYTTDLRIDW